MAIDTIKKSVDTELPAATLIADDEALPTTPRIGAIMQGMDAAGGANVDVARLAKAHDLDSGAGIEYGIGVSLRVAAAGGSIPETYGAGNVAPGTKRVTLAGDDRAVAALEIIDNIVSGAGANITQLGGATITAAAALADNTPTNPTTIKVGAVPLLGDGTANQGDRQIAVRNTLDSDGSGIAAAGMVGQLDDTSPTAVTENQFAPVRITPRRAQLTGSEISSRSDTYTATANGTTVDLGAGSALKNWSIQVVQTGTVTAWDVRLEGSLDGTNFAQIIAHTNADGTGIVKFAANSPVRYFRSRCAGLTLGVGTNVIAYILGSN